MANKKHNRRSRAITRIDPVRHLPPEIVVSIFIFAIQPYPTHPSYPYGEREETAHIKPRRLLFNLTSVSSSWRIFACDTPRLWSTCWLSYRRPEFNSLWLSRTGAHCPLDLYAYPEFSRGPNSTFPQPFLDSILPFAHRVRSLIIYSNIFKPASRPLITSEDMPVFQRLEIFRSIPWVVIGSQLIETIRMPPWLRTIVQGATRLRIFEAWENDAQDVIDSCKLADLVNVHIYSSKKCEHFFKILQSAPKLQNIYWCTPDSFSLPLPRIQHFHLTKLGLDMWQYDSEPTVLEALSFPALQCFSSAVISKTSVQAILSLFERSQCSIRVLYIRTDAKRKEDAAHIISILRSSAVLSTLEVLDLTRLEHLPFKLLHFLTERLNLPQLRRLSFGLEYKYPRGHREIRKSLSLITALGNRTKKVGDRLRYVECFFMFFWEESLLHKWGNKALIEERLDALSRSTKGKSTYHSMVPSLQFGSLEIWEAYGDSLDREELEPWILDTDSGTSRQFVYYQS